MKSSSNNSRFYEQLAPVYHLKVDWSNRSAKENELFGLLIESLKPASVLDLGCGDGGHAPRYAEAGIRYFGIDSSGKMIRSASQAHRSLAGVSFSTGDMAKLPSDTKGRFDQVIMLGNTLPHLLTSQSLKATLAGISRSLTTNGHFILQTVNPGKLTHKTIHFLPPKLTGEVFFAPFYLKQGDGWDFYMPIYQLRNGTVAATNISSTRLKFWTKQQLVEQARDQGLRFVASYGNAKLEAYSASKSENLILIFRKLAHARTSRG